ncbi:hypothetical protein [Phyllobacterium sp. P30BS-XVII]|uniref:hypothetical protein n=1 Tax=Phyllobacterium sp. P30BS-XVII TaxID=2587046 RepID=UPI000DD66534|nr:hypothetical protein [Phyllobacterium sp. P30BS-XVII]MBA8904074.1 hypothetical protein [Phyllobacterium sp. P30BS-XVII]
MSERALDLFLESYPIEEVVKVLGKQILDAIRQQLSHEEGLRYAIVLDLNEANLQSEFEEDLKDLDYGAFIWLAMNKLEGRLEYDRDLLFLL